MLQNSREYEEPGDKPSSRGHQDEGSQSPQETLAQGGSDDVRSFWEPKPPKVLMKDAEAQPLELKGQIQLYATNEYDDLSHLYYAIKSS